ncbi:hypothetical protein Dda_8179 [Drechslerella dactyloides]|uniref:Uncharacterized protein n=1 Tax=Drechslerella dactyloides TaxID=74499 RepID=A0AAD6NGD1_DREDA|nr:hypothetical protein Dda_8179 [Drechslerella dactyloides]
MLCSTRPSGTKIVVIASLAMTLLWLYSLSEGSFFVPAAVEGVKLWKGRKGDSQATAPSDEQTFEPAASQNSTETSQLSKSVILGKTKNEDAAWVNKKLPEWRPMIYAMDEPEPIDYLPVPVNKGREAMSYLSYLIDYYNDLSDVNVFIHAHEKGAWHNEFQHQDYSIVNMLNRLKLDNVHKNGYVNLRCNGAPGCNPPELHPTGTDFKPDSIERGFNKLWEHLYGNTSFPESVGVACCAQFAVSRAKIREQPREFYLSAREWILWTDEQDPGRTLEYFWHIMFGMPAVHNPIVSCIARAVYSGERLTSRLGDCIEISQSMKHGMMGIQISIPLCIFTSTAYGFYLTFAQYGAAPATRILTYPNWWDCYPITERGATVLGFAIYNNLKQTHYPTGIVFFHDPTGQCRGEPSLVVTISRRYGLFLVDLVEAGVDSPYTSYRLYDLDTNRYGLQSPPPDSDVPGLDVRADSVYGYDEGSLEDLIYLRNSATGEWGVVATVRAAPLPPGGDYTFEYVLRYGTVPENPIIGEPSKVKPFVQEMLQRWIDAAVARGPDVKAARYAEYLNSAQREAVAETGSMQDYRAHIDGTEARVLQNMNAYSVSLPEEMQQAQSLQRANADPSLRGAAPNPNRRGYAHARPGTRTRNRRPRPRGPQVLPIPVKVRMRNLLQANAQGRVIIPAPATMFEQPLAQEVLDPAVVEEEIVRYASDPTSDDVAFGWALLRFAEIRQMFEEQRQQREGLEVEQNEDTISQGNEGIVPEGDISLPSESLARQRQIEQQLEADEIESVYQQALQDSDNIPAPSDFSFEDGDDQREQPNLNDILDSIFGPFDRAFANAAGFQGSMRIEPNIAEQVIAQPAVDSDLQLSLSNAGDRSADNSQRNLSPGNLFSQPSSDYIRQLLQSPPSGRSESATSHNLLSGLDLGNRPLNADLMRLLSMSSPGDRRATEEAIRQFQFEQLNELGLSPLTGLNFPGNGGQSRTSSPDKGNREGTGQ